MDEVLRESEGRGMSFQSERRVYARKQYACDWCGEPIEVGEMHVKGARGDWKELDSWRLHLECHAAVQRSMEDADPDDICTFTRNMPRGIAVQEVGK